jgi:hypothetical protein
MEGVNIETADCGNYHKKNCRIIPKSCYPSIGEQHVRVHNIILQYLI